MKIVFATGNPHKLQEIQEITGDTDIEFILPPAGFDPVENGDTFEANSLIKAREAARLSGNYSLADDSGLCVDALYGAPGIHSARYAETPQKRIDKLLNAINGVDNRKAKFVCAMTLVDAQGNLVFQTRGECQGIIAEKQSGINGFGYDPIFLVNDCEKPCIVNNEGMKSSLNIDTKCLKTMAEMSEVEKNKISHRGRALKDVLKYIKDNLM